MPLGRERFATTRPTPRHRREAAAIQAARSLRSAVHGFVSLELAGGFGMPVDADASFAWLAELLADGIRAHAADA